MNIAVKLAALAAASTISGAANAAVTVYNFTGVITTSQVGIVGGSNTFVGQSFSGQFSFDSAVSPTNNGIQDFYFTPVQISFSSPMGAASGTGFGVNILRNNGADNFSITAPTSGAFNSVTLSTTLPSSPVGSPLPGNLNGQSFSFETYGSGNRYFLGNVRVSAAATGAVPEPATWAMMIAGFGMVGGTMRRHSVKVAYA